MKKEDEESKIKDLEERQMAIISLCRAVSRLFIYKLIKEKLSTNKINNNS